MFLEAHALPKAVKKLLIANIGIYIALRITGLYYWGIRWFSLIPVDVTRYGQIWRLGTYMFIHANIFWHLLFNMFGLWMFGPEVERRMGTPQFVFYYFLTGIGGAVLSLLAGPFSAGVTIGASGSIFGLLVAFGMLFPEAVITMIFPPVSMKAKHFVIIFGAIQFLMFFEGVSGIAWAVHIGAMLIGFLYIRYLLSGGNFLDIRSIFRRRGPGRRGYNRDNFIAEEIDPILDKISRVGIKGLTKRERQILKRAHRRI